MLFVEVDKYEKNVYFWGHTAHTQTEKRERERETESFKWIFPWNLSSFDWFVVFILGVMTARKRIQKQQQQQSMWPNRCEQRFRGLQVTCFRCTILCLVFFLSSMMDFFSWFRRRQKASNQIPSTFFPSQAQRTYLNCFDANAWAHTICSFTWQWRSMELSTNRFRVRDVIDYKEREEKKAHTQWHFVIALTLLAIKFTHDTSMTHTSQRISGKGKIESKWKCVLSAMALWLVCCFQSAFDWSEAQHSHICLQLRKMTEWRRQKKEENARHSSRNKDILYRDVNNNSV